MRFVTCIHFLEHIDSKNDTQKIIESAINVCDEFIFIRQPYSDKDVDLFNKGIKTFYSDWKGHTNLLTSYDFYKISRNLIEMSKIKYFVIFALNKVEDSSNPVIHPINSPIDQHFYDKNIHPPKDCSIKLDELYRDICIFLVIDEKISFDEYFNNIEGEKKDYL